MAAWLLAWFEYVAPSEGIEHLQSDYTMVGLRLMMSIVPAIFLLLAAGSLLFYKIDPFLLERIEADLAARNRVSLPFESETVASS